MGYVSCKEITPFENYKSSLKKQEYGVPSIDAIKEVATKDIVAALGKAETLVIHDRKIMHGSPDNISPDPRTNAFFVYNSVHNKPTKPFAAYKKRADFLCLNDYTAMEVES